MNTINRDERTPAKVFITSAYEDPYPITTFRECARIDAVKFHQLTNNAEEADIILFIENSHFHSDYFFSKLRSHPLVKAYPKKVFMYNPHDLPWAILPGMYANYPKDRFDENYIIASPYFEKINDYIQYDVTVEPKYLYSFYGAPSAPVRKRIFEMEHPANAKILYSTPHVFFDSKVKPVNPQLQYAELMKDSKFVLAPRGIGTSSIRLFEILQAGRVPVVMSDNFVFPKGPDWNKIAIILEEKDVELIPSILAKEEGTWKERAIAARKAYEDYFSPEKLFHYFVESLVALKARGPVFSEALRKSNVKPFYKYAFRKLFIEKIRPVVKPALNVVKGIFVSDPYKRFKSAA